MTGHAGARIVFWGRRGDPDTVAAQQFLAANHYAADRVLDLDAQPPTALQLLAIAKGLVVPLRSLVDPTAAAAAPEDEALAAWLAAAPARIRSPILLTPKGALVGFGERRWKAFLGIGSPR